MDIKTTSQPSIEQKLSVALQTELYTWIISAKHGCFDMARKYALYLKKDGDYMLFDCTGFMEAEGVLPYSEIQRLMRLYHYTQEATETLNTIKERHRRKKDE